MTLKPDYVAAFVDSEVRGDRDHFVHEALRKMHRSLAPDLQDRTVVESYYEPAANGWRLVMHRIPYEPVPSTPEEDDARRAAVLEEALADPRGLALAKAIIERKELHEALVDFKPGGTSADDDDLEWVPDSAHPMGGRVRRRDADRELNQEKIDAYNAAAAAVPPELRPLNPNLEPEYRAALEDVEARLETEIHADLAEGRQ